MVRLAHDHHGWTLAWWDFWFKLEWWQGVLAAWGVTVIILLMVRLVVQGIWVNPLTHDWMGANFDVFLGVGIGAMLWLAQNTPPGDGFGYNRQLNWMVVVVWFGFAMFKWWDERYDVREWSRRLGATSVLHVLVLVYVGGLYSILFVNTLYAPWTTPLYLLAHAAPVAAVIAWLYAGMVLDPKWRTAPDGRSKFEYTSPRDGWRNVRLVLEFARSYRGR